MKISISLALLFMLTFLVSCGQATSGKVKLTVSKGFAATDGSFDGGFVVHGLNTQTGEDFSIALSSGQTTNVNIPFGPWFIRVVGWDGNANVFQGTVLCDKIPFNFTADNQTVVLNVAATKCNDSDFASASFITSNSFDPLTVYTCGGLFIPTTPNSLLSAPSPGFCDVTYPSSRSLNMHAKSMKIHFNDRIPNGTPIPTLSSSCIVANASSPFDMATSKIIPTKIPVSIELFETNDCATDKVISLTYFQNGLENPNLTRDLWDTDSIVSSPSVSTDLMMPTGPSKRGTSGFITETPAFKCTSQAACLTLSSPLYTGVDYIVSHDRPHWIRLPNVGSVACSDAFTTTVANDLVVQDCLKKNNDIFLLVSAAVGVATTTFSLGTYTGKTVIMPLSQDHFVYSTIINFIGVTNVINGTAITPIDSFAEPDRDEGDGYYGHLSDIHWILSPAGLGGVFFDQSCSTTPLGTSLVRNFKIWDDGKINFVRAILTDPPALSTPRFIRGVNPATPGTTLASIYDRRFIIQESETPFANFYTTMIIDIACDAATDTTSIGSFVQVGRFEKVKVKHSGSDSNTEKELTFWNTSSLVNSAPTISDRFETYKLRKEYDSSGNLIVNETGFFRAEKMTPSSSDNFRITGLSYSARVNTGIIKEILNHYEIDQTVTPTIDYKLITNITNFNATAIGQIFSDNFDQGFKDENYYGYVYNAIASNNVLSSTTLTPNQLSSLKVLPNGQYLHAYRDSADHMIYDHFNGTNVLTGDSGAATGTFNVDLSPDGTKGIIVEAVGAAVNQYVYNGSTWSGPISFTIPSAAKDIQVAVLNSGDYEVAVRYGTDSLVIGKGVVGGTLCGNLSTPVTDGSKTYNGSEFLVKEISLKKTSTSFLLTLNLYDNISSTNTTYGNYINTCAIATGTTSCTSVNAYSRTSGAALTYQLKNLNTSVNSNGSLSVSFLEPDTNNDNSSTDTSRFNNTYSAGAFGANVSRLEADYLSDPYTKNNYIPVNPTTIGGAAGTAATGVYLKYNPPIMSSIYQMNLSGLNPDNFDSIFTPQATFESTGQ